MLAGPPAFTFARVPPFEDRLTNLRREGGGAAADKLAVRAADILERAARAELDAGAMEAGVSHYKIALAVDPKARGQSQIAQALRARGEVALAARRPSEAVRWAREALSLAEADPDAHALLGAALLASREYAAAAAEYGKALASRPHDAAFKRGLARARRRLEEASPPPTPAAEAGEAAPAEPADEAERAPASPPGETAPEQQQ
jgi:tetratricopeptide (TPR) repeat protein